MLPDNLPIPRPQGLPKTCTDAHLYKAVLAWCQVEPDEVVAQYLNVPLRSLKHWTDSREWRQIVDVCKDDIRGHVSTKLGRLTNKCFLELEDRLNTGDPHIVKDGEVVYAPVKAKDLAQIASLLIAKKEEVDNRLAGVTEKHDTLSELLNMASEMRERARRDQANVIDVTPEPSQAVDAIRELRVLEVDPIQQVEGV